MPGRSSLRWGDVIVPHTRTTSIGHGAWHYCPCHPVTVFHHTFAHFPSVIDSFWVANQSVERGLHAVEELIELLYCVVDQMVTSTTCGVQRMKPWWRWLKTVQRFDVHFCKCLWRLSHVRLKQLQWYWWLSLSEARITSSAQSKNTPAHQLYFRKKTEKIKKQTLHNG